MSRGIEREAVAPVFGEEEPELRAEGAREGEAASEAGEPLQEPEAPRRRYELLDDTGFDEVPRKYRRFYRRWSGAEDRLAPNEALCPVCKVVIRSTRELRPGDRLYCMACMTRLVVTLVDGRLEAHVLY